MNQIIISKIIVVYSIVTITSVLSYLLKIFGLEYDYRYTYICVYIITTISIIIAICFKNFIN